MLTCVVKTETFEFELQLSQEKTSNWPSNFVTFSANVLISFSFSVSRASTYFRSFFSVSILSSFTLLTCKYEQEAPKIQLRDWVWYLQGFGCLKEHVSLSHRWFVQVSRV